MLTSIEKLGVPIKYIELGNELYAQEKNYEKNFPSGKDYALKVNQWIPLLKKQFPHAQVAALLLGRQVQESNQRMYHWNTQVIEPTYASVDAYTYHIYINENKTFEEEKNEFIEVTKKSNTKDKPLWITEYGNNQDKSKDSYYIELLKLADFVEQFPHVAIALNHQLIGGTKNKITEDGKDFVKEGFYFLERVKK
jgi:alpha-L-arabinofuranosidase